jgi:hypothetical protein
MKSSCLVKTLLTPAALLLLGWPAYAAEPGSPPGQPPTAMPASASGLPALQGNAGQPPDSSPFTPDGPEKLARVKKLQKQITATYGLRTGREFGSTSWGPRLGKLYTLHKQLTDDDWELLAEMYISFHNSNWQIIAGAAIDSNDKKYGSRFDEAMETLLAMHGQAAIDVLNILVAADYYDSSQYKEIWKKNIITIKKKKKKKFWDNLPEYRMDQNSKFSR